MVPGTDYKELEEGASAGPLVPLAHCPLTEKRQEVAGTKPFLDKLQYQAGSHGGVHWGLICQDQAQERSIPLGETQHPYSKVP